MRVKREHIVTALGVPLILWLFSVAWSTKVDRTEYDAHLVQEAVTADEMHETLCAVKPQSRHCRTELK